MSELLNCPFCGGVATLDYWSVSCDCGATIATDDDVEMAALWNRRTSPWVSVEERLPDKEGWYLVYPPLHRAVRWTTPGIMPEGTTHWMELRPPEDS